jgi:hypothetical protein
MAGLDPATQCARVCGRKRFVSLAYARWLGGRLKGGHGEGFYVAIPSSFRANSPTSL